MATNPTLITTPFAQSGDKTTPPNTNTPSDGRFSQTLGFPPVTAIPLGSGGKAPKREDFNGAFNMLANLLFYAQKGWQFQWNSGQAYFAGCIVRDTTDGNLYDCINDVAAGGSVPSADAVHWKKSGVDPSLFANRDLSNLTTTGKTNIYNKSTPNYTSGAGWTYTTANTAQSYTAPSNGFLFFEIYALSSNIAYITVSGVNAVYVEPATSSTWFSSSGLIPVSSGATVVVRSSQTTSQKAKLTFYPCKEV